MLEDRERENARDVIVVHARARRARRKEREREDRERKRDREREERECAPLRRETQILRAKRHLPLRLADDGIPWLVHVGSSSSSSCRLTIGVAVDYTTPWIGAVVQVGGGGDGRGGGGDGGGSAFAGDVSRSVRGERGREREGEREIGSRGVRERAGSIAPKSERKESAAGSSRLRRSGVPQDTTA